MKNRRRVLLVALAALATGGFLLLLETRGAVMLETTETPLGEVTAGTLVSPDGKHVAYPAKQGDKWFVVVDGKRGKQYDGYAEWSIAFSPDGKHVAYVAASGNGWCVVVDGVESKKYESFLPTSEPSWPLRGQGCCTPWPVVGAVARTCGSLSA